jgi:hypothetical protein
MGMLDSGLPERVSDDEELARFLTSSRVYSVSSGVVKPSALLPNPKNNRKSVFRHGAEPRDALWQIGLNHLGPDQRIHGAAIFQALAARSAGLDVIAQEPPPRHADLAGWPIHPDPEEQKARHKELAALIAQRATLVLRDR